MTLTSTPSDPPPSEVTFERIDPAALACKVDLDSSSLPILKRLQKLSKPTKFNQVGSPTGVKGGGKYRNSSVAVIHTSEEGHQRAKNGRYGADGSLFLDGRKMPSGFTP